MTVSRLAATTLSLAMLACAAPAFAQTSAQANADAREANLRAYVELIRSDVRTQKVAILTETMDLTDDQDAKFWPIYRDYTGELDKINDKRVALIKQYADNFENMTDAVADKIATGALESEKERQALKTKYYERMKGAISPIIAARFLQVENQLLMIIDLQISASLPIVK